MFAAAGDVETVTWVQQPERDKFGDPVSNVAPETDIDGCLFAPSSSSETSVADGAQQVDTDAVLYVPPGSAIGAGHAIRARGDLYQVVGKPDDWGSEGIVVRLRRVTG